MNDDTGRPALDRGLEPDERLSAAELTEDHQLDSEAKLLREVLSGRRWANDLYR